VSTFERKKPPVTATVAKPRPQTRIEYLRDLPVDTSVRGNDEERAAHQIQTLKDWQPIRSKVGK
jgi:cell division protein FtsN